MSENFEPGTSATMIRAVQPKPRPSVRPIRQIPGFDLLGIVGEGGMGHVLRARQRSLDREVAIKLIRPELAEDHDFVERFNREASALATLSHPNIVSIFDRGQIGGRYYFVMEYVAGPSLRAVLDSSDLSVALIVKLGTQVARALQHAHRAGIIHRDLKPGNLLIHPEGFVKVVDFGLVTLSQPEGSITKTDYAMGSLDYMAPEQRRSARDVDGRADIYAFGAVLYEMLTGRVAIGRFPDPSELNPEVPKELNDLVLCCLSQDRNDRFQDASTLADALENVLRKAAAPSDTQSEDLIQEEDLPQLVRELTEDLPEAVPDAAPAPSPAPARAAAPKPAPQRPSRSTGRWILAVCITFLAGTGAFALALLMLTLPALRALHSADVPDGELYRQGAWLRHRPAPSPRTLDVPPGMQEEENGIRIIRYHFRPSELTPVAWQTVAGKWQHADDGIVVDARNEGDALRLRPSQATPPSSQGTHRLAAVELRFDIEADPLPSGLLRPLLGRLDGLLSIRPESRGGLVIGSATEHAHIMVHPSGMATIEAFRDGRSIARQEALTVPAKGPIHLRVEHENGALAVLIGGEPRLKLPKRHSPKSESVGLACQGAVCRFHDFALVSIAKR